MNIIKSDIIIIGAGLSGLTLAYLLKDIDISVNLIEARPRKGGRIHTVSKPKNAPIDMGATWLGHQHSYLKSLLKTLKLDTFEQFLGEKAFYEPTSLSPHQLVSLPANSDSSYRIVGGTSKVIEALSKFIPKNCIYLNNNVKSIEYSNEDLFVKSDKHIFKAKKVISTLPPYLLQSKINLIPKLPKNIEDIMESTHTWMGESIKIGLRFKAPFWKSPNSSGTIFSNVGPIPEFYDHSSFENNLFALKGFLNPSYFSITKNERLELILNQLRKYYGEQVNDYINYEEKVWRQDSFTHADYHQHILPHQNNGHALYRNSYFNDSLYIAGSETSEEFPGYMEGAVRSAYFVFNQILLKNQ